MRPHPKLFFLFLPLLFSSQNSIAQKYGATDFSYLYRTKVDGAYSILIALKKNRPDLALELFSTPNDEIKAQLESISQEIQELTGTIYPEQAVKPCEDATVENFIERTYYKLTDGKKEVLFQIVVTFSPGICNWKAEGIELKKGNNLQINGSAYLKKPKSNPVTDSLGLPPPPPPSLDHLYTSINWKTEKVDMRRIQTYDFKTEPSPEIPVSFDQCEDFYGVILNDIKPDQFPKHLWKSKKIQYLTVYSTDIQDFPKEIGKLKNLEFLWLRCRDLQSIPPGIYKLKNLKQLHISFADELTISPSIEKLKNLERISCHRCKTFTIPKELAYLPQLNEIQIDLSTFSEGNNHLATLKNMLKKNGALTYDYGRLVRE